VTFLEGVLAIGLLMVAIVGIAWVAEKIIRRNP
jgi:hypothetical protein